MTPQLLNNGQESEVSTMKVNCREVFFFFFPFYSLAEMTEKNGTSAINKPHTNSKPHHIFDEESTQVNCSCYYVVCVTAG